MKITNTGVVVPPIEEEPVLTTEEKYKRLCKLVRDLHEAFLEEIVREDACRSPDDGAGIVAHLHYFHSELFELADKESKE